MKFIGSFGQVPLSSDEQKLAADLQLLLYNRRSALGGAGPFVLVLLRAEMWVRPAL